MPGEHDRAHKQLTFSRKPASLLRDVVDGVYSTHMCPNAASMVNGDPDFNQLAHWRETFCLRNFELSVARWEVSAIECSPRYASKIRSEKLSSGA